ncbi:HAMP domain-containing histidine kinase [Flavobacterium jejuense]|uniref:histidine kinase n=1 Tax=Flavobacterium jejuense TaxID=1544455 RepID=A0ABX0IV46_9FLAO|nr:HAMP domain-containing sensor histidine kinase [Flavobacterium jejuense]NHN27040.1 HAMP domain-containing histidine kinase [Flavobacterium jejuense]
MLGSIKIYNQLFIRLVIILMGFGFTTYLLQKDLFYTSLFVGLLVLLLTIELYTYLKNAFQFYDKTIQAILQSDFSADFSKHKSFSNYKNLFKLYETLKNKQNEQVSKDIIYRSILNNVETGILILQKENEDWNIFFMNDYFSSHFEAPKVSKWYYLKNQLPSLCKIIEEQGFSEIKTSLQIRVNKRDSQTFVMQSSRTKTYNQDYYVVLLDSIQKVVEKKEKEAWINLMKVISHELLNSLTPIRSLSQNLKELIDQESLSTEDLDDMKQSVQTMLHRSDHLQQFVESYRKLAMLPTPQKEKTELNEIINNSLEIMQPLFKKENIAITNTIDFKYRLKVDKLQMEQVLINLLTNSIYALSNKENKQILITAETKEKRLFIAITDTGNGVEPEIENKIFMPFFTTRKEGAGIGLTLSKNIIEAHGGYLTYQNKDNKTTFLICLTE